MVNVKPYTTLHFIRIKPETIIFDKSVRSYCKLKYLGHPKGCPNFGKSPTCPPNSPYLAYIVEIFEFFHLVYVKFDFESYKLEMKGLHPDWSNKQLGNLLYWQSQIKKMLKLKIDSLRKRGNLFYLLSCGSGFGKGVYSMESVGIDVIFTFKSNNIEIEEKPKNWIILSCLLCSNSKMRKSYNMKLEEMK